MSHSIPTRWKPIVASHLKRMRGEERDYLSAFDFPSRQVVRVEWADHSFAVFRSAFCLRDEAAQEVAVFTEHCGYHFLSTRDDFVVVKELEES